jgi:hypothetical protein
VASAAAVSSPAEFGEAADDWHGADAWRQDDAAAEAAAAGEGARDDRFDPRSAEAGSDEFGDEPVAEPFPNAPLGRVAPAPAGDAPPERPVIQLLPVGSVAPGVPRICRTCRDFRPGEAGERGWCANQWAFTTRQMVHPDDPAPCETSVGSWWLPTDELCLADADVSTHGQPTPHLDRWLPHHRERVAERKRS